MSTLSSATSTRARPPSCSPGAGAKAATAAVVLASNEVGSVSVSTQRSASCTYGPAIAPAAGWASRGGASSSAGRCAVPNGSRMVKVVPMPSRLSAVMAPPWRPTSSLTSANPIPLPSVDLARGVSMRWKRSNSLGISAAETPMPVSVTVTVARASRRSGASSRATRTLIEPSRVNFNALESRLNTTFSHISRSRYTGSSSGGQSTVSVKPAWSIAERNTLASSAVKDASSTGSNWARIRPASMREKSSSVLTSLASLKPLR